MSDPDRNSELWNECYANLPAGGISDAFRRDMADAFHRIATRARDEAVEGLNAELDDALALAVRNREQADRYRADAERLDSLARFLQGKAGVTIEVGDLGMGPARVIEVWKDNADGVTLDHVGDFQDPRQAIDAARAAEGTK